MGHFGELTGQAHRHPFEAGWTRKRWGSGPQLTAISMTCKRMSEVFAIGDDITSLAFELMRAAVVDGDRLSAQTAMRALRSTTYTKHGLRMRVVTGKHIKQVRQSINSELDWLQRLQAVVNFCRT